MTSLLVLILAFHWTTFGVNVLIMFAGLSTMDRNLIEAASLDGAGPVQTMLRIVAPLMLPFIDFALITTLILSLTNIFGLIYAFNFGGPGYGDYDAGVQPLRGRLHQRELRPRGGYRHPADGDHDGRLAGASDPDRAEVPGVMTAQTGPADRTGPPAVA